MQTFLIFVLFIIGIVIIIKGGDILVNSSLKVSEYFGISEIIIGATLVSLATTMPELLVSSLAASKGENLIATGNSIGSIICNTSLVLGVSLIASPTIFPNNKHNFKLFMLLGTSVLVFCFMLTGSVNIYMSIILLVVFIVFFIFNVIEAKNDVFTFKNKVGKKEKVGAKKILILMLMFILGGIMIYVGAELMINNGTKIAKLLHLSEEFIAITIFAIGTSLPELITTIVAIKKGAGSLSLGNIIGSNIINLTLLIGVSGVITGNLEVSNQTAYISLPVMLASILIVVLPIIIKKRSYRYQGILLVGIYSFYIIYLVLANFLPFLI